jgi:hypothetical protein
MAQPDGVATLEVMDGDRPLRRSAVAGAAQLTHDRLARIDVDPLPDERRPAAVGARFAARGKGADALAQELALEVGLGDAEDGS